MRSLPPTDSATGPLPERVLTRGGVRVPDEDLIAMAFLGRRGRGVRQPLDPVPLGGIDYTRFPFDNAVGAERLALAFSQRSSDDLACDRSSVTSSGDPFGDALAIGRSYDADEHKASFGELAGFVDPLGVMMLPVERRRGQSLANCRTYEQGARRRVRERHFARPGLCEWGTCAALAIELHVSRSFQHAGSLERARLYCGGCAPIALEFERSLIDSSCRVVVPPALIVLRRWYELVELVKHEQVDPIVTAAADFATTFAATHTFDVGARRNPFVLGAGFSPAPARELRNPKPK